MTHFWIPVGARVAWAHHSHHPTIDSLPGLNAAQAALLGVSFGVHIHLVVHLVENVESPTGWEWDDTHDEIRPINMVMRQWCAQKWWNHPLAMWKRAIEMGKEPSGGCNQQLANMMNIDFLTYSQSNRMFMFHKIGSGWCFWTVGANVGLEKGCKWGIHIYKTYLWMLSCIFTYFIVFTLQDIYRIRRFLQLSMSSRSAGGSSFDPNSFWVKLYWPLSGGEQASWARDYDHYRSMDQFGTGQTRLRSKKNSPFRSLSWDIEELHATQGFPNDLICAPTAWTSVVIWQVPATLAGGRGHRSGSYTWGRCATQVSCMSLIHLKKNGLGMPSVLNVKQLALLNHFISLLDPRFSACSSLLPKLLTAKAQRADWIFPKVRVRETQRRQRTPRQVQHLQPGRDASGAGRCLQSSG